MSDRIASISVFWPQWVNLWQTSATVVVNGQEIGIVKNGEKKNYFSAPGTYKVAIRHKIWRSRAIKIDLTVDQHKHLIVQNRFKGWQTPLMGWCLIFWPHRFFSLREVASVKLPR